MIDTILLTIILVAFCHVAPLYLEFFGSLQSKIRYFIQHYKNKTGYEEINKKSDYSKKWKRIVYFIAKCFVVLLYFSSLYLMSWIILKL